MFLSLKNCGRKCLLSKVAPKGHKEQVWFPLVVSLYDPVSVHLQKTGGPKTKKNKLRWYPQQPHCFIITHLSEACCEAERWKPCPALPAPKTCSATFSWPRWTWLGFAPRLPGTFSGTFSGTLLNLTWLCTKASQTLPSPEPCWTWLGFPPGFLKPSPEPSFEPCWTNLALHQTFSGTMLNLTGLCTKASLTSGTFSKTVALHQSLPGRLRTKPDLALHPRFLEPSPNLLRNPIEPDLAFHQASWNLLRNLSNPVELDLALHQSLPDLLRNLLWNLLRNPVEPDLAFHQASWNLLRSLLSNPVEPDLALHQSLPDLLRNLLWNLLRNPVEPDLAFHQASWNLLRNVVEPDPAPAPVHTGAILGWRPH